MKYERDTHNRIAIATGSSDAAAFEEGVLIQLLLLQLNGSIARRLINGGYVPFRFRRHNMKPQTVCDVKTVG